jgi:hypothetical protein
MGTRVCVDCKIEKSIDEFYKHWRTNPEGDRYYKSCCKKCSHERVKQWRQTPKGQENRKRYVLHKTYGITLEDWNQMLSTQKGCCAICERPFEGLRQPPFVDHDHTTGRVRGLLCPVCNQFLGLIKDNPQALLNYLNPYPGWPIMYITDWAKS